MVKFDNNTKYIDGYLKTNLDLLTKAVELNWDGLLYFSGYEGDGKTTLASQIAYYLDRNITLDQCVFTAKDFKEAYLSAKPKQCILFDESYLAFSNKSMWNEESRILISMLTMIRKKQLYILIVAPTFFDIQKYIAIHRSRALIHIYSKGLERGYLAFYNRAKKLKLYVKGRKDFNMNIVKPNFVGRFTKWFPFDNEAYDEKKEKAIQELRGTKEVTPRTEQEVKDIQIEAETRIIKYCNNHRLLKLGALKVLSEDYYNLSTTAVSKRLRALKE